MCEQLVPKSPKIISYCSFKATGEHFAGKTAFCGNESRTARLRFINLMLPETDFQSGGGFHALLSLCSSTKTKRERRGTEAETGKPMQMFGGETQTDMRTDSPHA